MRIALLHSAIGMDGTPVSPLVDHLGLECLQAALSTKHEAIILDSALLDMDTSTLCEATKNFDPQIIGIVVNYANRHKAISLANWLKQHCSGCLIITGGFYPAFHQEELLLGTSPFDTIVIGDGEKTIKEIAEVISHDNDWRTVAGIAWNDGGRISYNPPTPLIDLSQYVSRDLANLTPFIGMPVSCYRVAIEASRGCDFNCSFCSIAALQKLCGINKRRTRSADSVVNEIEIISEATGLKSFWFMDADFIGQANDNTRILEIASQIKKRNLNVELEIDARADSINEIIIEKLAEAGLKRCFIGAESFDDQHLKKLGKRSIGRINEQALHTLEKFGIRPIIGMLMFSPYSTREQLKRDHAILQEFGYEKTQMLFRLKKYRGTKEALASDSDGRGITTFADYGWRFKDPFIEKIWNEFDTLRLIAMERVFGGLTRNFYDAELSADRFQKEADEIFHTFGEQVDFLFRDL